MQGAPRPPQLAQLPGTDRLQVALAGEQMAGLPPNLTPEGQQPLQEAPPGLHLVLELQEEKMS